MSTNIVFTVPGRNQNYLPIDINTTKEDILEKYARWLNFLMFKKNYYFLFKNYDETSLREQL